VDVLFSLLHFHDQYQYQLITLENSSVNYLLHVEWDVKPTGSTGPAEYFPEQLTSKYGRQ